MSDRVVVDWLVHGGHQYEFFKTDASFLCSNTSGSKPNYRKLNRPKNQRVTYLEQSDMMKRKFNIVMVRAGVRYAGLMRDIAKNKAAGIAVVQTHCPFSIPNWVKCVVWNSEKAMIKNRGQMPYKKHFYIPHGFDPKEFVNLGLDGNGRILTGASAFEKRASIMGFNNWRWVADQTGLCDVVGHANPGLTECVGNFGLEDLVRKYNEYSLFLNTTVKSAMPRTRGEALMCGSPVITTRNYGIEKYLVDKKSCLYADTKEDMLSAIIMLLTEADMREDIAKRGREIAVKHFNIKEYKERWKEVFYLALK